MLTLGGLALLGNIFELADELRNGSVIPRFHGPRNISNGWTHLAKFGSELLDLLARFREGAGAINSFGGVT
jgi:hypothetical protein